MEIQNYDSYILQNILFPSEEICNVNEMYFKGVGFSVGNKEIKIKKGGCLSLSTYFNSFSLSKWIKYTGIDNLKISLDLEGEFALCIYSARLNNGAVSRSLHSKIKIRAKGNYIYSLPFCSDDILYFELTALEDNCVFKGGFYATDLKGRVPNRIKLAIGICTFRREEFIIANLDRLAHAVNDQNSALYNRISVFISDNGQTLPLSELESENIHIVYNKNLGGAGGFTRCLVEALNVQDKERFTNFLFLDDDILLSVYAVERNVAFLSMLLPKYQNSVIGGAMFSTDERYLQFESAAKWQRTGFVFNRRDIDMRDTINILLNEQEYDVNYNAWCYCCIPFSIVTKYNLPLPIFFHMDDVEYGLRNKLPVITLNGINVWHLYKKALVNAKNDYYDVRNRLIMLSQFTPELVKELAYIYLNSFTKEALKFHYARCLNGLEGIIDFSKGYEWFRRLDTEKKHKKLFNNVKWKNSSEDIDRNAIVSMPDESSMRLGSEKRKIALNHIFSLKNEQKVFFNDNSMTDTIDAKSICVYVPSEQKVIYYRKNNFLAFRCLIKHYKALRSIKKSFSRAIKEFNYRITELQTGDFWTKYLNIPNNLKIDGKKVLFVASDNDATSGAFRSMVVLSSILQQKYSIEVCVLLPKNGDGTPLLREAGVRYIIIDSEDWIVKIGCSKKEKKEKRKKIRKTNICAIKKLCKFLQEEKFDLVHINTSYSYIGAIAAKKKNIPVVWHIREFLEEDQTREMLNRKKGYLLLNSATNVVAISDSIYNKYKDVCKDKIVMIYNGIDHKKFYLPQKSILENNKIIFICVGAITHYKGQHQIVEAFNVLCNHDKVQNIELWLVGSDKGEYAETLRGMISKYDLSDRIKFLGRRQDVAELYKQADIACVCSKSEAFGRITVEAMMAGNLVIGADTAGTKEIVEDGIDGLLFKSGDSESLYEKIVFALKNKEKAKELASHGRQTAIEKFTAEKNAEEIYKLYQEIWKRK